MAPLPHKRQTLLNYGEKRKTMQKSSMTSLRRSSKKKKEESAANPGLSSVTTTEIDDINETMRELKKQFVRLRDCDIANVKELLVSFGFATIDAEGEADALCANLSLKRRVDACMSDDTDMFVYGCPVVLRNISLLNHSVMSYNTREILKSLSLTQQEFKMMSVVCGTDYSHISPSHITHSPESVYKQLTKFKTLSIKEQGKYHDSGGGFYDWYAEQQQQQRRSKQQKTPENEDLQTVSAITYLSNEGMFDVTALTHGTHYKQLIVLNRENIQKKRIIEIMTKEDFIFIEPSPSDETIMKSLSDGKSSLTSSPVYGLGAGPGLESPEQQATFIAKEVYGVNDVSSFRDLHTIHKKSKPRSCNGSNSRINREQGDSI